jgi:ATP-dependent 26S proteasome regulatory subunit
LPEISVRMLREELQLLQEPGSYVGEVVKVMGKSKVLVKVNYLLSNVQLGFLPVLFCVFSGKYLD